MAQAFPILTVGDVLAAEAFYTQLGFARSYAFGDDDAPRFVAMDRGADSLGLAAGPADHSFAYWVYVDDVDTVYGTLLSSGATAVEEPTDQPWGERTATVRDPDGNVVHVGRAAPS